MATHGNSMGAAMISQSISYFDLSSTNPSPFTSGFGTPRRCEKAVRIDCGCVQYIHLEIVLSKRVRREFWKFKSLLQKVPHDEAIAHHKKACCSTIDERERPILNSGCLFPIIREIPALVLLAGRRMTSLSTAMHKAPYKTWSKGTVETLKPKFHFFFLSHFDDSLCGENLESIGEPNLHLDFRFSFMRHGVREL